MVSLLADIFLKSSVTNVLCQALPSHVSLLECAIFHHQASWCVTEIALHVGLALFSIQTLISTAVSRNLQMPD